MHMSLNFFYVEQRWQFFNSVMKKSKIRFHLFQLIVRDLWTSPRISESTFSLCHNDLIHFNQCLHAKSGTSSIVSNHDFWRENSNYFCQIRMIIYSFKYLARKSKLFQLIVNVARIARLCCKMKLMSSKNLGNCRLSNYKCEFVILRIRRLA